MASRIKKIKEKAAGTVVSKSQKKKQKRKRAELDQFSVDDSEFMNTKDVDLQIHIDLGNDREPKETRRENLDTSEPSMKRRKLYGNPILNRVQEAIKNIESKIGNSQEKQNSEPVEEDQIKLEHLKDSENNIANSGRFSPQEEGEIDVEMEVEPPEKSLSSCKEDAEEKDVSENSEIEGKDGKKKFIAAGIAYFELKDDNEMEGEKKEIFQAEYTEKKQTQNSLGEIVIDEKEKDSERPESDNQDKKVPNTDSWGSESQQNISGKEENAVKERSPDEEEAEIQSEESDTGENSSKIHYPDFSRVKEKGETAWYCVVPLRKSSRNGHVSFFYKN